MKCTCGSTQIENDSSKGENFCRQCGKVLEESNMVAEITFTDQCVQGKFGSKSGNYTQMRALSAYNRDSNEIRLQKAHKLIQQLASNLNLNQYHVDAAQRLFNLAHHRNFVQGRHTTHVVAAALYIVCREEKTPHLLIDFSDCLQINLYVLGSCFLKLVKLLHLELPLIDPSLFIHRFCARLEFNEKTHEVSITSLRMKLDWLCYGRRPASLCGAAILIAARYHGFKRTTNQIVQTVHVCDETIRKRLEEFKETSVARLTREEFERLDLEKDLQGELDPPSFKRALKSKEFLQIKNYEDKLQQKADKIESFLHNDYFKEIDINLDELINEECVVQNQIEQQVQLNENILERQISDTDCQMIQNVSRKVSCNSNKYKDEENLSEISESEITSFILTPEESQLKSIIWHNMNKDWLDEQVNKKKISYNKKFEGKKRKKKMNEMIDAPDACTALTSSSKLHNKLNQNVLKNLFDMPIQGVEPNKKLKLECL